MSYYFFLAWLLSSSLASTGIRKTLNPLAQRPRFIDAPYRDMSNIPPLAMRIANSGLSALKTRCNPTNDLCEYNSDSVPIWHMHFDTLVAMKDELNLLLDSFTRITAHTVFVETAGVQFLEARKALEEASIEAMSDAIVARTPMDPQAVPWAALHAAIEESDMVFRVYCEEKAYMLHQMSPIWRAILARISLIIRDSSKLNDGFRFRVDILKEFLSSMNYSESELDAYESGFTDIENAYAAASSQINILAAKVMQEKARTDAQWNAIALELRTAFQRLSEAKRNFIRAKLLHHEKSKENGDVYKHVLLQIKELVSYAERIKAGMPLTVI